MLDSEKEVAIASREVSGEVEEDEDEYKCSRTGWWLFCGIKAGR